MKIWTTARGTRVARVILGRSNVYCVSKGSGALLVDTGWRRAWPRLSRALAVVAKEVVQPCDRGLAADGRVWPVVIVVMKPDIQGLVSFV